MTENLLPKLNDYEYNLLMLCLRNGGDEEREEDIRELFYKVKYETIEMNKKNKRNGE